MPKEFYTERDIEDMFKRGILSLQVNDNVVLTELAYEKANRLGMQLLHEKRLEPPAAPIRPYLAQKSMPAPLPLAGPGPKMEAVASPPEPDLTSRIRSAVLAQLGGQVD